MKHIKTWIIPDCPHCGKEMTGAYRNTGVDDNHPWGTGVDGWWYCPDCGYETEHRPHRPYDQIEESEVTE